MAGNVDPATLVEQAPDSVIFADREGNVAYWNAASERIFGFTSEEAMGQRLDIIIPEQFRVQHWTGFERALAAGETKYVGQALPTKALHKDGHDFYVELSFAIVKDGDGTVLGALAHARDITERFLRDRDTRREVRALKEEVEALRTGAPAESAAPSPAGS